MNRTYNSVRQKTDNLFAISRAILFDGRYLGDIQPWKGTVADIFVQMQFPLHSGRILGLPGRILVSVMGLVVAMLSVTGVYIWWKKRRSRQFVVKRTRQPADAAIN